jgi:EmrB/QacA subfamily drug resistance transporter
VSLAVFMSAMDTTIVATALPTLRRALHAPINWTSWSLSAYTLGLAVAMPVAGRLSDQLGRRRVFLVAGALFTLASLLCGCSVDVAMLIVVRLFQAIGGGAFVPSASGIIVDAFGGHRTRALGLVSGVFPLGALVGPIVGGVLLANFSWRSIFFVNVPVGVLTTALALRYLPRSKPGGGRTDLVGAAEIAGALLGALFAVTRLGSPHVGVSSPTFVAPAAASIGCLVAVVRRARRVESPLIPLHLLRIRAFVILNALNFVWGACAVGFGSLIPLYAEDRYAMSPLAAGALLTARAVAEVAVALAVTVSAHRIGYRRPMIAGYGLLAVGTALVVVHPPVSSPYVWMASAAALCGLGIGAAAPSSNNASIELAPSDIGAIAGLRGMFRQAGGVLGVALTTSLASRSSGEARSLETAFIAMGLGLAVVTPLIIGLPERAGRRGADSAVSSTINNP